MILAELQENGRLTVTELADRVQLTPAPCHRRLRELERAGVITGYRAVLDPAAVGLGFEAIVSVTLERGDAATVAAFETAIAAVPQIRHAERLFGDPNYLLRAVAADLNEYAALRDRALASLPGIMRITSTIVMKRIVDNRPLPLPGTSGRPRSSLAASGPAATIIWGLASVPPCPACPRSRAAAARTPAPAPAPAPAWVPAPAGRAPTTRPRQPTSPSAELVRLVRLVNSARSVNPPDPAAERQSPGQPDGPRRRRRP
jgi:DNA-binding Lrp family transcriptional regulator